MSLKPEIWGKDGWKFLHFVSLGYPENPTENEKEQYKNFYYSIRYVLPCHKCAQHYTENIKKVPLSDQVLSDKNKLIDWVIDIHNEVNKLNNKSVVSYSDARQMISKDYGCNHNDNNTLFILIGILFALITIAIIYKKKTL